MHTEDAKAGSPSVINEVRPWYLWLIRPANIYPEIATRLLTVQSTRYQFRQRMALAPRRLDEVVGILQLRLRIADLAQTRSRNWVGRVYNAMAGENPYYARFYGQEVRDILGVLCIVSDDLINPEGQYDLRLDVLREALAAAEDKTV